MRTVASATLLLLSLFPTVAHATDQPKTLLTRIAEWQYPGADLSKSTMGDAATVDQDGNRTVPSVHCKTVLTTDDPIDKVVKYYKDKLTKKADLKPGAKTDSNAPATGRSVTFHSDVSGRPVAIHIISVNSGHVSTTLVISRAQSESQTHIAWSQYEKMPLPDGAG